MLQYLQIQHVQSVLLIVIKVNIIVHGVGVGQGVPQGTENYVKRKVENDHVHKSTADSHERQHRKKNLEKTKISLLTSVKRPLLYYVF